MESIDPDTRHPKALHPYIDEVKDFLTVSGLSVCERSHSSQRNVIGNPSEGPASHSITYR